MRMGNADVGQNSRLWGPGLADSVGLDGKLRSHNRLSGTHRSDRLTAWGGWLMFRSLDLILFAA
jgi:hypothetical protein